jgi:hypothetical protein
MPPRNQFNRQDKLKMLDGMVIFSRDLQEKILISDGKFMSFALEEPEVLNYNPTEEEVDKLCDDLFFEEYHMEPDDEAIEYISENIIGFDNNVN